MHHRLCSGMNEVDDVVAIAYSVKAVMSHTVKTQLFSYPFSVDAKSRTCHSSAAEGTHISASPRISKSIAIAFQHLEICEEVVAEGHRLSLLQVGVTRYRI